jgi:hypothetical protein
MNRCVRLPCYSIMSHSSSNISFNHVPLDLICLLTQSRLRLCMDQLRVGQVGRLVVVVALRVRVWFYTSSSSSSSSSSREEEGGGRGGENDEKKRKTTLHKNTNTTAGRDGGQAEEKDFLAELFTSVACIHDIGSGNGKRFRLLIKDKSNLRYA